MYDMEEGWVEGPDTAALARDMARIERTIYGPGAERHVVVLDGDDIWGIGSDQAAAMAMADDAVKAARPRRRPRLRAYPATAGVARSMRLGFGPGRWWALHTDGLVMVQSERVCVTTLTEGWCRMILDREAARAV